MLGQGALAHRTVGARVRARRVLQEHAATARRHRMRERRASRRRRVRVTSEESAVEPYPPSEKQLPCDACFETKLVSGVNPLQLCDFSLGLFCHGDSLSHPEQHFPSKAGSPPAGAITGGWSQ